MPSLTALQVKNAKPGRFADGEGLYLLVKPTGAKSWLLRVQDGGRRRDYGLGSANLLSLQDAREKARAWRKMAKEGLNPSAESKKARRVIPTFEEAARSYHASIKASWKNGKHRDQWLSTLTTYAFPTLGKLTVSKITAADIQTVLAPIWLSIPETARRVRQRIGTVLDYSHGQGWREHEAPLRGVNTLMKRMKQPKPGNFAAMPYADVPAFLARLDEMEQSTGRLALKFAILTAARSGEVRGATWGEIDLERLEWTIPRERMKMGEAHTVPLSAGALAIVKAVRPDSEPKPDQLLFPGQHGKRLSDMTLSNALRSTGGGRYTVHGFRSSFRDWCAEKTSYRGEVAEAALAHAISNRVEAAYRRTKFLDRRRHLMDEWAGFLGSESCSSSARWN